MDWVTPTARALVDYEIYPILNWDAFVVKIAVPEPASGMGVILFLLGLMRTKR